MGHPAPALERFATLPRFYRYTEVLDLFGGDWDAFLDAWVGFGLPESVRAACRDTLPTEELHLRLLERSLRQQGQMVALLRELIDLIRAAPTVETV